MDLLASIILAAVCVVICEVVGGSGSIWTRRNLEWFYDLRRPSWTPPGYLIGIIWTSLFFLIGIALFLIIEQGLAGKDVTLQMALFIAQFALNVSWNYLFFGLRSLRYGLMEIAALWVAIALTIIAFWQVSTLAAVLLIPYIVWVSIATTLNASIYGMNKK
jgi:tryptophan-rich sensory protein